MLNFLDLLVVVFMVLTAASLLALCLMFLARNPCVKKVSFFVLSAVTIYAGYIGVRIGQSLFPVQTAIGILVAAAGITAMVLAVRGKDDMKKFRTAQYIAAATWLVGISNAFLFLKSI